MNHDDAEAAAMRQHYAAPAALNPYTPETPDALRDGLLRGWRKHMEREAP